MIFDITSENTEDVCTPLAWEGEQPVAISGHSCAYATESIIPRYLAYLATAQDFQISKRKVAKGAKVIEVAPVDLARVEIPAPSIGTQQKVVDILDRFDTLTKSLTDGIPAEIEARINNTSTTATACSTSRARQSEPNSPVETGLPLKASQRLLRLRTLRGPYGRRGGKLPA